MAEAGSGSAGLVMLMTCTPSYPATTAYVPFDMVRTAIPDAPPSLVKPLELSAMAEAGSGSSGLVMSITCTPPSYLLATTAYVPFDMSWVAIPDAPRSWVNRPAAVMESVVAVEAASVTSITYTPSPMLLTATA